MSLEIKVPSVGESIAEVTISQWTKSEGDYVEMDEIICELESDKATFELNAEASGTLHIRAEEGDTLEVGSIIAEIDTSAAKASNGKPNQAEEEPSSTGSAKPGEVLEMKIPTVGESINEVVIASWLKPDGGQVELDEPIAEIESDKATFELTAEASGILRIEAEEGSTLEIGALVCKIETTESTSSKESTSSDVSIDPKAESPAGKPTYATAHASPAAAKILAEKGIAPGEVNGTGRDGRITKEDALKVEKKAPKEKPKTASPATASQAEPSPAPSSRQGSENRHQSKERVSQLRKTVARRLVSVKNDTAMLTTFNEVDMKPIMDLRKKYKESFKEKYEVGLGFMSFFAKACCMALEDWPSVNAYFEEKEIIYNHYCDISIAVSSPRGLVVPVIRNAEKLGFHEIEKEVVNLATKAREGKLSIEEMQGGTFTITNGGIFGSMMSTPIINSPQSAILGMHNILQRPVVVDGEIVIRPMMYLALSYDHRIIDGRESVSFLVRVKELIEDPSRLLLGI